MNEKKPTIKIRDITPEDINLLLKEEGDSLTLISSHKDLDLLLKSAKLKLIFSKEGKYHLVSEGFELPQLIEVVKKMSSFLSAEVNKKK